MLKADNIEVTSPTTEKPGDAKKGEGNLTMGQAAAQLFAKAEKDAAQKPDHQAAEEKAPESDSTPPETPSAAEASPASESAPAEETASAETTEASAETNADADTVHSQKSQFTPEQQEIFNKRLGKEVAKTKAIEAKMAEAAARLAELEAKLNQSAAAAAPEAPATPAPVVVLGNQPLAEHNDFASLQKLHQSAKEAVRFVEETLDSPKAWKTQTITDPDTGEETTVKFTTIGKETYTEADLKASARRAKITLEDHIPARAQFLTARTAAQEIAFKEFPFLKDKSSPEYQMAEAARRDPANAAILAQPNADWIIGVQIEGMKAIKARKEAAQAPAPKPKPPAAKPANDQTVVSTSAASIRQPAGGADRQALVNERMRLSKKGGISSEDAVKFLQQSELLRKSR